MGLPQPKEMSGASLLRGAAAKRQTNSQRSLSPSTSAIE